MAEDLKSRKDNKIKQFFKDIIEKIDKKMEEESKSQCCCKNDKRVGNSCCK